jgi:hypothetical protein
MSALQKLTPRERMVFDLKHFQGMKLRAVGEILNIPEATVKGTLFRATHKLRLQLARYISLQNSSMNRQCNQSSVNLPGILNREKESMASATWLQS